MNNLDGFYNDGTFSMVNYHRELANIAMKAYDERINS